ncbi:ATP-binding protein [Pseudomonas sp. KNUC1026]|uniref:ATP-binding protein n=1 Tax=Pseudomonas sp. KNUC1026 TaxID=2893890 RepID=UPI001F4242C8|nr:ATP-binding protein [Pseudomonas sp. KNUC1026]UFH48357.1 GAF domain-containing protein [Pseudomonas sp. KNUC1026]
MSAPNEPTVTLANCEDEPIHLPGAIQPHGALLALDGNGTVLSRSGNFETLTGLTATPGHVLDLHSWPALLQLFNEAVAGTPTDSCEFALDDTVFDVISHVDRQVYFFEFEPRTAGTASFNQLALYAQRVIGQMQRRSSSVELLERVTEEIRTLTGYDRVMAYRFRPDLSGEVIAESRREDLVSYLGQRYPASDIPAQARRLYIQNPVRLIADAAYQPTALDPAINPLDMKPFDLSLCDLRSVSPIHCEYLANMGVRASMSVSIVVGGKLWGLFACHHMAPKTMPHPVRLSFQVISQVCSALVERFEQQHTGQLLHDASELRNQLAHAAQDADDLLTTLGTGSPNIAQLLPCDGAVIVLGGRSQSIGGHFDNLGKAIIEHLAQSPELDIFHTEHWPHTDLGTDDARYCGVLAVRFHANENGWVIWLRLEEVHHVRWGGKPEKIIKVGPSGPRLTPRGSFEAWEEIVRGRSPAWTATDLRIAEELRSALVELSLNRAGEVDRMRQHLIAMLGHDLRNPLQSISMAASMLTSSEKRDAQLRQHISQSSGRMERLISQVLEMSRLQSGMGLMIERQPVDISQLTQTILDETRVAFPGMEIDAHIPPELTANLDPDRYAQIITNLLGNARYHGLPGEPVRMALNQLGGQTSLAVTNAAPEIPADRLATLFQPFKQQSQAASRNRNGLGIGLYISQAIAAAHSGQITVSQQDGAVTFNVIIPSCT